jgi:intracellular sulfur oxidation DsrE/DsrF family protein
MMPMRIILGVLFGLALLGLLLIGAGRIPMSMGPATGSAEPMFEERVVPQVPEQLLLDISVHTLEELQVLLDRVEELTHSAGQSTGPDSVILILHGPEVEFFAAGNYPQYKDVVDQAARLDALDIIDVKICQTMMNVRGVARDDIPAFIEQVPNGLQEIDRLVKQGYVYF